MQSKNKRNNVKDKLIPGLWHWTKHKAIVDSFKQLNENRQVNTETWWAK